MRGLWTGCAALDRVSERSVVLNAADLDEAGPWGTPQTSEARAICRGQSMLMTSPNKNSDRPVVALRRAEIERLPEHPLRILVAEDDHLIARQLCTMLVELGREVIGPAGDGEAALALARTRPPDLALLDIRMPNRDGLDTARILLAELGVPSVIVSAHATQDYANAAAQVGVFGYLVKPVMPDQLRMTLDISWQRFRDYAGSTFEASDLRRRMEERRVIEHAKWVLVAKQHISEPEAMRALQERARSSRQPLLTIAQSVIESGRLA